jgi:hypothetical protein
MPEAWKYKVTKEAIVGPDHGDCALVVGRKKVVGDGEDKSKVNLEGCFVGCHRWTGQE